MQAWVTANTPELVGFAEVQSLKVEGHMKQMNRRELVLALSAFAALGSITAEAQTDLVAAEAPTLARSAIFAFDKLLVKTSASGIRFAANPTIHTRSFPPSCSNSNRRSPKAPDAPLAIALQ